jgi:class 3 adenylate cyclase
VHVGIECGEVLVSPSWEPARFAVWGRAVTMAKRLCDTAGPGTIHIGQLAYENGGRCVLAGWNGGLTTCVSARLEGIADNVVIHSVTLRTPALCGGA